MTIPGLRLNKMLWRKHPWLGGDRHHFWSHLIGWKWAHIHVWGHATSFDQWVELAHGRHQGLQYLAGKLLAAPIICCRKEIPISGGQPEVSATYILSGSVILIILLTLASKIFLNIRRKHFKKWQQSLTSFEHLSSLCSVSIERRDLEIFSGTECKPLPYNFLCHPWAMKYSVAFGTFLVDKIPILRIKIWKNTSLHGLSVT